ncbi:MAG: hypothetical protein ABIP35_05305, partial [Ginsengibacter sp.]
NEKTVPIEDIKAENQPIEISLLPKVSFDFQDNYISETSDGFFNQFGKHFCIPKNFYIHSLYSQKDFNEDDFLKRLEYVIQVFKILNNIKDYKKSLPQFEEFFLYATNPLIIQTIYNHTNESYLDEANEILSILNTEFKSETYKSFLKIQIIILLGNILEKERFSVLLDNFKTIYVNFKNSVELFFKEYDYQKNKNEIEQKKVELAKKIHGVVNEIGTKIITIPLGYLLILKELKADTPFSFLNILFLFIAIIYSIIIETSISNQFLFLKTLSKDIEEFLTTSLSSPELEMLFTRYKTELNETFNFQRTLLRIIRAILWLLPIIILTVLIVYYNSPRPS